MNKVTVSKLETYTGHKDSIYTLERSQFDHIFFSGAGDGMVVSWDLKNPDNGQLIAKLPNSIYGLHLIEGSNVLAVGHNYDGLHFIDWVNKKEVGSLKFTEAAIFDVTSYKNHLYVGDADGYLNIIELNPLKVLQKIKVSEKSVRTIAVNLKKLELAVGTSDHSIVIYNLQDYSVKYKLDDHDNSVFSVCYSPDNELLLSAGRDAHLKIWDVNAGYLLLEDIVAHMYAINNITFSPDGKHFVTCSMDKSIKVWDASAFKLLKVIDKARHAGHGTSVNKLLWTGHDDLLISASDDRSISIWDIAFNS
ncbi:WD40 repeat domain-containing protein [Fulvivirga sp.]|uniref:WD40 repeat domain-containing protein n=2 Tax=Fulvivirga sp. TaxID=1931237 RepID=UPI0032EE9603